MPLHYSSLDLIDLDAPITDYVELPFDAGGATVREVLGMRSGFPAKDPGTDASLVAADLSRVWTPAEWLATIPADAERLGERGGEPRYSGVNYVALAALVEKVTGKSFNDVIRTDLLAPAGLVHTWAQPGEVPTGPLTVGGQNAPRRRRGPHQRGDALRLTQLGTPRCRIDGG